MIENRVDIEASALPILEISDLHTHYGASHILRGVALSVDSGESVALLGRNGTGKTTLIRSILGLVLRTSGSIRIDGQAVHGAPPHEVARLGVALVPEGRGIFPNLTAAENLAMSARADRNAPHPWTLQRVLGVFPDLAGRMDTWGDLLSGGEQQMLAIGRALMTNPRLLILDEATEGLAPRLRHDIWSVIQEIKSDGIATLVVDKDLKAILSVCDRCIILDKGSVVFSGTASELTSMPDIHVRYLGV